MSIISEQLEYKDIMSKKACANCLHSTKEHELSKCYGLDFDGNTYSSCKCTNLSFEFKIRFTVPDINLSNGNSI